MRPGSIDDSAILTTLRGDDYPATNVGIARAIEDLVPRVKDAWCGTSEPGRAIVWVTVRRPWWAVFTFGRFNRRMRERVRHVAQRFGAWDVTFEVRVE